MKIIRTKFNKEGDMIYISHLDLQQLLQRAFRRAEIDLVHSQGFNPHPKIRKCFSSWNRKSRRIC